MSRPRLLWMVSPCACTRLAVDMLLTGPEPVRCIHLSGSESPAMVQMLYRYRPPDMVVVVMHREPEACLGALSCLAQLLVLSGGHLCALVSGDWPARWLWQTLKYMTAGWVRMARIRLFSPDITPERLARLLGGTAQAPSLSSLAKAAMYSRRRSVTGLREPELQAVLDGLRGVPLRRQEALSGLTSRQLQRLQVQGMRKIRLAQKWSVWRRLRLSPPEIGPA